MQAMTCEWPKKVGDDFKAGDFLYWDSRNEIVTKLQSTNPVVAFLKELLGFGEPRFIGIAAPGAKDTPADKVRVVIHGSFEKATT